MKPHTDIRPLTPLVALGAAVYGVVALEIWILSTGDWAGMGVLLGIVIATAVTVAIGVVLLLNEPDAVVPAPESPAREPVVAPTPAPAIVHETPAPERVPEPAPAVRRPRPAVPVALR